MSKGGRLVGSVNLTKEQVAEIRLRKYCGESNASINRVMGRNCSYYLRGGKTYAERIAADPSYRERHRVSRHASQRRREADPEYRRLRSERYFKYHRAKKRRYDLSKFGITPEEYDALSDQQGDACAICSGQNARAVFRRLAVDHSHANDTVRGLLCDRCNRAIGWFLDEPALLRLAADYLEAY